MSKATKIFIVLYVLFIIVFTLYSKYVLSHEELKEKDKTQIKTEKEYTIDVSLALITPTYQKTYYTERKNTHTVMNLLENLREKQGLVFEKLEYSHGPEIYSVLKVAAPEGYKWSVVLDNTDITNQIKTTRLSENAIYELRLTKIKDGD